MIEYYFGEKPILDNVETYDLARARRSRRGARPARPTRVEAGRRFRRLRPRDRSGARATRPCASCRRRCSRIRGAGSRRSRSRSRPRRRTSTARWAPATSTCARSRCTTGATCGSCPGGLDARRAARGQPRRELEPGRRIEGHVGAGGGRRTEVRRSRADADSGRGADNEPLARQPVDHGPPPEYATAAATTTAAAAGDAVEPDRGVAVLGRSLQRAGGGGGAHPRRVRAQPARGPARRRGSRVRAPARRARRRRDGAARSAPTSTS